jgi:CHASE1-domain containing sensor protein
MMLDVVDRDLLLLIASIAASGFLSWLVTHVYYRKSLERQEAAAEQQLSRLMEALEQTVNHAQAPEAAAAQVLLRQRRIEEGVAEYRRAGTPVYVIDSYADLDNEQKAELLDAVLLRVRGRPAKNNKYRQP